MGEDWRGYKRSRSERKRRTGCQGCDTVFPVVISFCGCVVVVVLFYAWDASCIVMQFISRHHFVTAALCFFCHSNSEPWRGFNYSKWEKKDMLGPPPHHHHPPSPPPPFWYKISWLEKRQKNKTIKCTWTQVKEVQEHFILYISFVFSSVKEGKMSCIVAAREAVGEYVGILSSLWHLVEVKWHRMQRLQSKWWNVSPSHKQMWCRRSDEIKCHRTHFISQVFSNVTSMVPNNVATISWLVDGISVETEELWSLIHQMDQSALAATLNLFNFW